MPQKADDFKMNSVWSILSKGRTGSGKTIASCGKEFRPVYVFDTDQRMTSVIDYYRRLDGNATGIEYDSFHMGMSFNKLDKRMDELLISCPYKTVVLGSLTSYIHIVLVHILNLKAGVARNSNKPAKNIAGIQVNELEDYNAEDAAIIFELIGFLMALKGQGVNIILEAHVTPIEYKNLDGSIRQTVLEILTKGKKAPAQIPGYFDEVWNFEKKYETGMVVGSGSKSTYEFNPNGNAITDGKTSRGLVGFDWTGKDFTVELMKQVSDEVKAAPRVDPNKPKKVGL